MAFVEFHTRNENDTLRKISVNEDAIGYFEPVQAGRTAIYITGGTGGTVYVTEDYDEVVRLLNPPADF